MSISKYTRKGTEEKTIEEPIRYRPPTEEKAEPEASKVDALQRRVFELEALLLEKERELDQYRAEEAESPPQILLAPAPALEPEARETTLRRPLGPGQKVEHRGYPRHIVDWRATLAEDQESGKPAIAGRAYDVSLGGTSFLCREQAILPPDVLLMLDMPLLQLNGPKQSIKVRGRIVYIVLAADYFRVGIQFREFLDDGRNVLESYLNQRITYF